MMKRRIFLMLLMVGSLLLGGGPARAEMRSLESLKLRVATYDGKWDGSIRCLYDPGLWPEDECDVDFTFEIKGGDFQVQQSVRSKKGEVTNSKISTQFSFTRLSTNAVAISLNAGNDEDGTWIETWTFVMTLKDPNHMIAHWTRVVNNVDMPPEKKGSKFSSVGMGVLTRRGTGV